MAAAPPREGTAGTRHRKRFKNWQNLSPPQTRFLSSLVESNLVAIAEAIGFQRVDISLGDPGLPVSGSEITLERGHLDCVDSVDFNFEKYKTPRFQIHFSRRELVPPHSFVRSGNFVARRTQHYHFWGKPWGWPTRLWPELASARTVEFVRSRIDQVFRFLETGETGPNIRERVYIPPPKNSQDLTRER